MEGLGKIKSVIKRGQILGVSFLFWSLNLTAGLRVPQAHPLLPVQIVKSLLGRESDEQSQQPKNIEPASSVYKKWGKAANRHRHSGIYVKWYNSIKKYRIDIV